MEDLISQISSRTGISDDQARQAVDMVVSFAKTKLPEPLASQLDTFLNMGSMTGMVDQVQQFGNLGGMFGEQK